jgi:hypothetical protein
VDYDSVMTISPAGDARPMTVHAPVVQSDVTALVKLYAARRLERSG